MSADKNSAWHDSERRTPPPPRRMNRNFRPTIPADRTRSAAGGAPSTSHGPALPPSPQTLEEAFPEIDPNFEPMGSLVLLQVRIAKRTVGESRIELPDEVIETIQANTTVAKVISHGPLAFKNRNTGTLWPEGAWVKPGDFVRIPRIAAGGERYEIRYKDGVIQFILMRDLELPGRVPRPLEAIAYI